MSKSSPVSPGRMVLQAFFFFFFFFPQKFVCAGMLTLLAGQVDSDGSQKQSESGKLVSDVVLDLTSPPRIVARSSQNSSQHRKASRPRWRCYSLAELMRENLVRVGDELSFQGETAVVLRDAWLEVGRDTSTLEAFVVNLTQTSTSLEAHQKEEIKNEPVCQTAYELIRVNGEATLWELSEKAVGAATTLKIDPENDSSASRFARPAARSPLKRQVKSQQPASPVRITNKALSLSLVPEEDSAPLSIADEPEYFPPKEEEEHDNHSPPAASRRSASPKADVQAAISTQLPEEISVHSEEKVKKKASIPTPVFSAAPVASAAAPSSKRAKQPDVIVLDDDSSSPVFTHINKNKRTRPAAASAVTPEVLREMQSARECLESTNKVLERRSQKQRKTQPAEEKVKEELPLSAVALVPPVVAKSSVVSPILLGSGLTSQSMVVISGACAALGGKLALEWSVDVTHIVIKVACLKLCACVLVEMIRWSMGNVLAQSST
jgi:hypothetical protein